MIVGLLMLIITRTGIPGGSAGVFITKNKIQRKGQIGGVQAAVWGCSRCCWGSLFQCGYGDAAKAAVSSSCRRRIPSAPPTCVPRSCRRRKRPGWKRSCAVTSMFRLDFYNAGNNAAKIAAAEKAAAALQSEIWAHTVAADRAAPTPITASFILSLNETIDLDAARLNALRSNFAVGAVGTACWWSPPRVVTRAAERRAPLERKGDAPAARAGPSAHFHFDSPRQGLVGISQQPVARSQGQSFHAAAVDYDKPRSSRTYCPPFSCPCGPSGPFSAGAHRCWGFVLPHEITITIQKRPVGRKTGHHSSGEAVITLDSRVLEFELLSWARL